MHPSHRLQAVKPYFFEQLTQKLLALSQSGIDIIRMDVGSPDLPPASFICDVLAEHIRRPDVHGYTPYGGTPAFKQAVGAYYQHRYGVKLDPASQVVGLLGSKEGIFKITQAIINPGDIVLVPTPGYTTYQTSAEIAGGQVWYMPLRSENGYLPDYAEIPSDILNRAKFLWLNYPNNPTGAIAPLHFFQETVNLAHQYGFLVLHDAPYMEITFDGYTAPSILQAEGAFDVCVEFNSLSKTYNMAGWRLGMACGSAAAIRLLHQYKSHSDSSHFGPIFEAGVAALTGDQTWVKARNEIYQRRRDMITSALQACGIEVTKPQAALYIWAKVPHQQNDIDFCTQLLENTGVSVTPGTVYGDLGKGYFRVSLCTPEEKVHLAMTRLAKWVNGRKPA